MPFQRLLTSGQVQALYQRQQPAKRREALRTFPTSESRAYAGGAHVSSGDRRPGETAKLGENAAGSPHLQSELPVVAPGLPLESRRPRRGDKETRLNGQLPGTHMRPCRRMASEMPCIPTAGGSP
jgi:hypothetical protein